MDNLESPKTTPAFQLTIPRRLTIIAAGGLLSIALAAITIAIIHPRSPFPKDIAQKALFDLYYPSRLPDGYAINQGSFQVVDGTVVFGASNPSGDNVAFTEQAIPKDFDFNNFYQSLQSTKKLNHVPFTTVAGHSADRATVMSVLTSSTWIIISSHHALNDSDLQLLATHLRQ